MVLPAITVPEAMPDSHPVAGDKPFSDLSDTGNMKEMCCIVPAYNNAGTLKQVLIDVAQYIRYIIVINDGSTDHTGELLYDLLNSNTIFKVPSTEITEECAENQAILVVIHHSVNKGKGAALQKGFERAAVAGFRYAITIDADGQHFADDIPHFATMIRKYPGSLIVGARNMQQDGIPGKSSFGNRFSNFWYKIETGIKLPDTQSGFRLYPVGRFTGMHFYTNKYEFEIEILVRAAWKGCRIRWTPVQVYYAPEENRISHFRPFLDFVRISLLNTVLVLIALLWIKPRDLIRNLNWQKTKRFVRRQFVSQEQSATRIALSSGFGVFMGILPIWGYQLLLGLTLAHFMKLNKAIVFITANISIPPMIPVILYMSFLTGGWIVGASAMISLNNISLDYVKHNLYQYLVGSICFAVVAGITVTMLTWFIVTIMRKR